jgi:hypothetical protein
VSHKPLRKENDCLNCGAIVQGRFCHICGQENVVPKETFWQLLTHFVYDITHFDGKFFSSVKYLLTRPGFLSLEYMRGRRNNYLNPIRMYVFTSAFFFIFFFSVYDTNEAVLLDGNPASASQVATLLHQRDSLARQRLMDTTLSPATQERYERELREIQEDLQVLSRDSSRVDSLRIFRSQFQAIGGRSDFLSLKEYDSIQQSLPAEKQDGWVKSSLERKRIKINEKFRNNADAFWKVAFNKFLHLFPQMMFFSLPLFAFGLKLLYVRNKRFYYADHGIFTVHLYCAMFIFIFILMLLWRLQDKPYFDWVNYVILFIFLYIAWFIYKSIRNFYQQPRGKTILKFLLLQVMFFCMLLFLFVSFFSWSLLTI